MHRIVLAASLAAIFIAAACGNPTMPPSSPTPSVEPSQPPSPSPTVPAPASPTPDPTDLPSSPAPTEAPAETPSPPTAQERYLLDGVLRGAQDCVPVRGNLPRGALAGIECAADDPDVAQVGFYLFANEATMLDIYFARMEDEGFALDSGGCADGEGESAYIPDEGVSPSRYGCFVNEQGYANLRMTLPGANVYVGILGNSDDTAALSDFAWLGNQDTPGNPTLWGESD